MRGQDLELGYLVPAPGDTVAPAVVVIHDVWGLAPHTRDVAERLAREGFHVLAVDLYRRERAASADGEVAIEDAGAWIRGLDDRRVVDDLEEAAAFVQSRDRTLDSGPGLVGFCMGGMYALLAACQPTRFRASVPFYGLLSHDRGLLADGLDPQRKPSSPLSLAPRLACPMLAFFGAEDELVHLDDVEALERALRDSRFDSEVVVVPGAGHAFMNDTRADAFRPEAAATAWARSVAFLRERLAPGAA